MITQISRFFWVFTLLFLAGVALLSARLTSVFVAKELWVAESSATNAEVQRAEPAARQNLSDYRVIETRNVFNANPKPPEADRPATSAPQVAKPVQTPVQLPPLNLTLVGTVVVAQGRSYAFVEMGGETKLVREQDEIAPSSVLQKVLADRIRVDRAGKIEEFLLYPPPGQATTARRARPTVARRPQPPPEPESTDETVRQVDDNNWLIDSREVEQATSNMSQLMTQIRVVPNFTDGQPDGFKVFAIRPGSLFSKIGLQNGDVIKRINGLEIQGPEEAFEAYQRLQNETAIQIDLARRGQNQTFNYEIR